MKETLGGPLLKIHGAVLMRLYAYKTFPDENNKRHNKGKNILSFHRRTSTQEVGLDHLSDHLLKCDAMTAPHLVLFKCKIISSTVFFGA